MRDPLGIDHHSNLAQGTEAQRRYISELIPDGTTFKYGISTRQVWELCFNAISRAITEQMVFVARVAGWLAGRLAGCWLAGWLAGWLLALRTLVVLARVLARVLVVVARVLAAAVLGDGVPAKAARPCKAAAPKGCEAGFRVANPPFAWLLPWAERESGMVLRRVLDVHISPSGGGIRRTGQVEKSPLPGASSGPSAQFFLDDDELDINPPTPCQIGKRPPAPKPKSQKRIGRPSGSRRWRVWQAAAHP